MQAIIAISVALILNVATIAQSINKKDDSARLIRVIVALCDNENQGIVPVPAHLGRGDEPSSNLYWGAMYGSRNTIDKDPSWKKVQHWASPESILLERILYRSSASLTGTRKVFLLLEAYRGDAIREAIQAFLALAAGSAEAESLTVDGYGNLLLNNPSLLFYVGHNGLMDFSVNSVPNVRSKSDSLEVGILACASHQYFAPLIEDLNVRPVLWTSNLCAPEGYVLQGYLAGFLRGEDPMECRKRAASAYSKMQKISLTASLRLWVIDY